MENYRLGKFIAYILRHRSDAVGIELDGKGFADVGELIDGITATGRELDFDRLKEIVETDEKIRFSFNADYTKIRANQGHSFKVDVQMDEGTPPDVLYHGTAVKYLESIKSKGIIKKTRNFVHLSKDEATAVRVGARHGKPVVLVIDCKRMAEDGNRFFLSANGVWQTEYIPFEYVTEIIE